MKKEKLFLRKKFGLVVRAVAIQLLVSAVIMIYVKYVTGKMMDGMIQTQMIQVVLIIIIH